MEKFFIGWHQPGNGRSSGKNFDYAIYSINRLEKRKSDFLPSRLGWILDSGAFTKITSGKGHLPVGEYARQIVRWSKCGKLMAAVCQDWMCEPFILKLTGLSVSEHQRLTLQNYQQLKSMVNSTYIMPVLQSFKVTEYLQHLEDYGDELMTGQWVGVGSVCKRNSSPKEVEAVLNAIKSQRPDLKLHGFGLKKTALRSPEINSLLYSADSAAAGLAKGQSSNKYVGSNCPHTAQLYYEEIMRSPIQLILDLR